MPNMFCPKYRESICFILSMYLCISCVFFFPCIKHIKSTKLLSEKAISILKGGGKIDRHTFWSEAMCLWGLKWCSSGQTYFIIKHRLLFNSANLPNHQFLMRHQLFIEDSGIILGTWQWLVDLKQYNTYKHLKKNAICPLQSRFPAGCSYHFATQVICMCFCFNSHIITSNPTWT